MFKIPKQEYTAEFKEVAVKRVNGGQGIRRGGEGPGPGRADAAQLGEGSQGRASSIPRVARR